MVQLSKVAIVGSGHVGSSTAFSLIMSGAVSDLVLIDKNKERAEGEALDLLHGLQFVPSVNSIEAGDSFSLVKDAAVVIVCAGVAQKKGQTRSELVKSNLPIFKEVIPEIVKYNKQCILLVVTNPLDVMTYVAYKLSGLPSCRVFGTGTVLDSARLRALIGKHFQVSPKDVTAHVLGEHGDSQFVWWSGANIAGIPLQQFSTYSSDVMNEIYNQTRNAAYEIINKKGATYFAIAMVVTKIIRAILRDQSRVFTLSHVIDNVSGVGGVCLGLPLVVRRSGVCQKLSFSLNNEELCHFHDSARRVRQEIDFALGLL